MPRPWPSIAVLLALLIAPGVVGQGSGDADQPVEAQSFKITSFRYDEVREAFVFRGRCESLANGTTLIVNILLEGNRGDGAKFTVEDGAFDGQIETVDKRVLAGNYCLEVIARRSIQRGPAANLFPAGIEEDDVARSFTVHGGGQANALLKSEREAIYTAVDGIRPQYDLAAQLGNRVFKQVQARLGDEGPDSIPRREAEKLIEPWAKFYREAEEPLVGAYAKYRKDHLDGIFVTPFQTASMSLVTLFEGVIALRSSYSVEILGALGLEDMISDLDRARARFKPKPLITQINAAAWSLERALKWERSIWSPRIEIGQERGRLDGDVYVSSTSRFSIERPGENWHMTQGPANSPLRVAFDLKSDLPLVSLQVQMIEFPWAETDEEKVAAWIRLAEYEWPNYAFKGAEWVDDPEGNHLHYKFWFRSRSKETSHPLVTCYLFLPSNRSRPGVVYGVLIAYFGEGIAEHHEGEMIEKAALSFEFVGN